MNKKFKYGRWIRRMVPMLLLSLMVVWGISGCTGYGRTVSSGQDETSTLRDSYAEKTGTYFDTVISIRVYGENADTLLGDAFAMCAEMEETLSAQLETSELYRVNHRDANELTISDELAECIRLGLYYSELTEGAFSISLLPVKELWDFSEEDHQAAVPDDAAIQEALQKVDDTKIHLSGNQLSFDSDDTQIDLGGIAKGYISGKIKTMLRESGCTSALINLGGNVSTLGTKPGGDAWSVGVQKPFADRGEILTIVSSVDNCVISSGTYERYFISGDRIYHHILDPETGYPAETNLNQVTLIGEDDAMCDALATAGIILGRNALTQLLKDAELDAYVLFTDADDTMSWYPNRPEEN